MGIKLYRSAVIALLVFIAWQVLQIKAIEFQGFNVLFTLITGQGH